MKNKAFKLTETILAMAFLMGCSQSQILLTLEASVAATEALVATLQQSGKIDPATANAIENAIAGLPAAFQDTAAELSSIDTQAIKTVKITGYYASTLLALKVLPAEAQAYTAAIVTSIQIFLSSLPQTAQANRSLSPTNAKAATAAQFDATRLKAIGSRATLLRSQITELKAGAAKTGEGDVR